MLFRILCSLIAFAGAPAAAQDSLFRVTLLGTGTPELDPDRAGPSTLVEAGKLKLLFDAGRMASVRMKQVNVLPANLDAVFFSHYHSDHTIGFPDVWLIGWIGAGGRRKTPLSVYGPVGIKALMSGLEAGYSTDTNLRAGENFPPEGVRLAVTEFQDDGVVFEKDGVKITAFTVKHGAVKPAVGYRIDYNGKVAVISGDTTSDPNVAKFAAGADVLIHEVMVVRPEMRNVPLVKYIMGSHTSPQEAGETFKKAGVKVGVYTHILRTGNPRPSADDLIQQTREIYSGRLEVGVDLMSFEIGEQVVVRTGNR